MANHHWMETWLNKGWEPNFHHHPSTSYMECVIVEPRPHPWLGRVLRNVSCMFPKSKLSIVYDAKHHNFVTDCIEQSNAVQLYPMHLKRDFTVWDYCELLTNPNFWDLFRDSKRTLIFQADTGIRKNRILRYLEYSYIGAPWGSAPKPLDSWIHIGNGGLSLRDPVIMKEVCHQFAYKSQDIAVEDLYFSQRVANMDHSIWPEKQIAGGFAFEHELLDPDPMGFHQIYNWHPQNVLDPLLSHCDSVRPIHSIQEITDAYIEATNGRVIVDHTLTKWLESGIGPNGLVIPVDSLVPYVESVAATSGYAKSLVVSLKNKQGNQFTKKVPLKRKRVMEGVHITGHE